MKCFERLFAVALAVVVAAMPVGQSFAADTPVQLSWADLVPANMPVARPDRTFFAGATRPDSNGQPAPPPLREGKFMSVKRRQPGDDQPPPIVTKFNGKQVQIGGYIVPLDFEATTIKEFLLVPFVGACIHVPPPPANQIIYVKAQKGIEVNGSFEPVNVTGTLKAETAFTGLADAGYSLAASGVQIIKK